MYDIDYDFERKCEEIEEQTGKLAPIPDNCIQDETGLYILPNGKYLPVGAYEDKDGTMLIYEPLELQASYNSVIFEDEE